MSPRAAHFYERFLSGEFETAKEMITEFERELKLEAGSKDTARLDWLEDQHVAVRVPAVYGSKSLFHSFPTDGGGEEPSDIRAQVDAHMEKERKENREFAETALSEPAVASERSQG
jgi:hypothetical protein